MSDHNDETEEYSDGEQRDEQFERYEKRLDQLNEATLEAYAAGFAKAVDAFDMDRDVPTNPRELKQVEIIQESHYYYWDGKTKPLEPWLRELFLDDEQLVTDGGDTLDARRATGIVKALASGGDEITCSDCGGTVDVSEAESEIEVLAVLENHRQESHE